MRVCRFWGSPPCASSLSRVVFLSVLCGAEAATIEIKSGPSNVTFIRVSGTLKSGDEKTFSDKIIEASSNGTVFLEGPGGDVLAATEIGTRIRLRGFQTVVSPDERCASACALVWLGGRNRSMAPTARVGFHAVYRSDDDKKRESGAGNALVGAYLRDLGLS